MLQLAIYLRRRVGPIETRRMLNTVARTGLAGALVGAACALALAGLGGGWQGHVLGEAAVVAGGLVVAVGFGYALMKLLRVEELATAEELFGILLRRLRPTR